MKIAFYRDSAINKSLFSQPTQKFRYSVFRHICILKKIGHKIRKYLVKSKDPEICKNDPPCFAPHRHKHGGHFCKFLGLSILPSTFLKKQTLHTYLTSQKQLDGELNFLNRIKTYVKLTKVCNVLLKMFSCVFQWKQKSIFFI